MNPIVCEVLLIVAAFAVGILWPRKKEIKTVEVPAPVPPPSQYGLFLPPGCNRMVFKNMKHFFIFKSEDYITIDITPDEKMTLTFRVPQESYKYKDSDIEGIVK